MGEYHVREGGVSSGYLWTTRDSHQWRRHPGVPTLPLPHRGILFYHHRTVSACVLMLTQLFVAGSVHVHRGPGQ